MPARLSDFLALTRRQPSAILLVVLQALQPGSFSAAVQPEAPLS